MSEMSPEQAAAKALGDESANMSQPRETVTEPSEGPFQRLFDGNADGPSTTEMQHEYGLPTWGAILGRGVVRAGTGSGVPPVFEIVFGAILGVVQSEGPISTNSEEETESDNMEIVEE